MSALHGDGASVGGAGRRGIALIMVVVVLMALLLIATPFAISMRDHKVSVVMTDCGDRAREDLHGVVDAVVGRLARSTHFATDDTPDVDSIPEIAAAADLEGVADLDGSRNPRGTIWSARVEDEQGKLNINAVSPFALGNLMGARTVLGEKISDAETEIPVEDSSVFDPEGGYVVIGAELIRYSGVQLGTLTGCERGVNAVEEEEARLGVTESYYFSPGSLVRISDGVRTDYAMVSHVSVGFRSLMNGRGGSVRITTGFTQPANHDAGLPVMDARVFAVNLYRILRDPGRCYRYPTITAVRQITELGIPGFDAEQLESLLPNLTVYSQHEAAARWGNHRSILNDFTYREQEWLGYHTRIEFEVRYPVNVNTASARVLHALLQGLSSERDDEEIELEIADKLVQRILEQREQQPLEGHEDFLERVLEPAREAEEVTRRLRDAIYSNLFDSPMLAFLKGGTHRAIFKSLDTFRIEAGVSRNNAAGVELSRRRAEEVVSVAPPRLVTFGLDTQWDFEEMILPGRYTRFMTTFPINVETQQSPQDPPVFDPPNRSMKQLSGYARNKRRESRGQETRDVFASRENEGTEGEDEGSVRYRPHRSQDGPQSMRGTEPTRYPVESFDRSEDIEGERLTAGTRSVSMSSRGRGRRGRRGSSTTGMSPMAIGLWYRPLWEGASDGRRYIWGTGDSPDSDKVELYHDGERGALVLEIADTSINDEKTFSRAYFPIRLRPRTWYHIACVVAGTRPDQMQILVDGVPYRGGEEKQHIRFLTRLTADLSEDDTTISVEDTEGFPDRGTILIGEEKVEYGSKTKTAFRAIADAREAPQVKRGRGSRGTGAMTHVEGAAVQLYGYANAIQSEIPAVKGRLVADGTSGLGVYRPALLNGKDPIVTVRGAPLGITADTTSIPLYSPEGDLSAFPPHGYALLLSARMRRQGPQPTQQDPNPAATIEIGGAELIHYQSIANSELQNVTRAADTPFMSETFNQSDVTLMNPTEAKSFLNGTEPQLQVEAESGAAIIPTWVVPISLSVSDSTGYLDPAQTGFSERVQIAVASGIPEWVRYDEVLQYGGGHYFVRSSWNDLAVLFNRLSRRGLTPPTSGRWTARADAMPSSPFGEVTSFAAIPISAEAPPELAEALADLEPASLQDEEELPLGPLDPAEVGQSLPDWLEFRGTDDTEDQSHANNADIVQVFRTELPGAGPDDRVTLVDAAGATKERHTVVWGAAHANANRGNVARLAHFVGFTGNTARQWLSDTDRLRNQGQRGEQTASVDRTPSQISWDTRQVARILLPPSGELPVKTTNRLIVGGTFGGRRASCIVDEVETFTHTEGTMRRVMAPPSRKLQYQFAANPATTEAEKKQQLDQLAAAKRHIGADEVNITLAYADVWTDFDGITRERENYRGSIAAVGQGGSSGSGRGRNNSGAFSYTRRSSDDRDCGLIRIGDEFIVYRGIEQDAAGMQLTLQNCIRGAFDTEPAAHEQGEAALFLSYVEMTVLSGALTAEAPVVPVSNTRGFPPQGYFAVFDDVETGTVREVIGYTQVGGGGMAGGAEFRMPERVTRDELKVMISQAQAGEERDSEQAGTGIFRGRFGTLPASHSSDSIVLRLPFRYWDRAARNADNPELGYYQFPLNRPGSFFKSLSWAEHFPQQSLDVRVLARVDQRASWADEPNGKANGLYEFMNPRGANDLNRIDMQGNLLEVRVFFEYREGAFHERFNADGWKATPWLTRTRVEYVQPNQVLYHEQLR